MVEMSMGQDDSIDAAWLDRKWSPVLETECLKSLEQTAIDQDAMVLMFNSVFGAGDSTCASQE